MDTRKNLTPEGVLFKSRFGDLVERCGGVKRAELLTRVGQRVLYDYYNPERCETFAPLDVVSHLEKACGVYPVTEAMCFNAGGYFVRPRQGDPRRVIGNVMPSVGKNVGDLLRDAFAAAEDGKLTDAEIAQLRDDIVRTMTDLADALGVLDRAEL